MRSKKLAVSISLQTKAIRNYFRVLTTGIYPQSLGKSSRSWSKPRCAEDGLGYSFSLEVKWGYISAQKLEGERSKSFALSISMQTKAIRSYFRVPGAGKYPPFPGKSSQSWSQARCAYGGLGYSFILKVNWGNISAQKLESQRSESFAVSISLQSKTIRSYFRVRGTGKYPPSSGKSSRSWSKLRCA